MFYRLLIIGMAVFSFASRAELPGQVNWPLRKAFVPQGFDDNDKVQITVSGEFPNGCFHVGPYRSKVDVTKQTIFVQQVAYSYQAICLQFLIPFMQVIDVGLVPAGDYKVVDATSGAEVGKTSILRSSNPGPDDFLYAIVDDASVSHQSGKAELTMNLKFPDRCTVLDRVDIHYTADTIIVQPVAIRAERPEGCPAEVTRLTYTKALQEGLTGEFLLHVRSMNGQAINKIVEL